MSIKATEAGGRVFLALRYPAPHQVEITVEEARALAQQILALPSVQRASDTAPLRDLMESLFPDGDDADTSARLQWADTADARPAGPHGTLPLPRKR